MPGILTADPRLVPDARLIPQLHHREAAEVAHYGAKVLHPRALIPIAGTRIVLHVRSFLDPDQPGHGSLGAPVAHARIRSRRSRSCRGQAIVTVAGKGMVGVHGIAARTFARGRRRAAVGLDDLPGVVGELDRVHGARDAKPNARSRACARRFATSWRAG